MGRVHALLMEELLPIGEFSARCGLSAKMLRTYASAGLLTPAAVDRESGYRYYSPAQVQDARLIGLLRRAGVPLTEVGLFLCDPTPDRLDQLEWQLDDDTAARREARRPPEPTFRAQDQFPRRPLPATVLRNEESARWKDSPQDRRRTRVPYGPPTKTPCSSTVAFSFSPTARV